MGSNKNLKLKASPENDFESFIMWEYKIFINSNASKTKLISFKHHRKRF